jgi:hypothetical protein
MGVLLRDGYMESAELPLGQISIAAATERHTARSGKEGRCARKRAQEKHIGVVDGAQRVSTSGLEQ